MVEKSYEIKINIVNSDRLSKYITYICAHIYLDTHTYTLSIYLYLYEFVTDSSVYHLCIIHK